MTQYNSNFELTLQDIELIEAALLQSKHELASQMLTESGADQTGQASGADSDEIMRQIHELLGRLHNQKVFFRPRAGAYVSG